MKFHLISDNQVFKNMKAVIRYSFFSYIVYQKFIFDISLIR
ncbi:hypothetical protein J2Y38_004757 [Flavobacterium sp. 2755]|nr:hypothetical protein [Flavobacterium sp. 2755]